MTEKSTRKSDHDLLLRDYRPVPRLVVKRTEVKRPKYPVIDAHNHLGAVFGGGWIDRPVRELLEVMDESGVECLVDLDGGWGETILDRHLDHFKESCPERFIHFGGVDWGRWEEQGDGFGEWAAARLRKQVRRGAQGLKVWKGLGLHIINHRGELARVNDPRLGPIWATAGELGIPVLIHVADPVAFFDPLDGTNERWEELKSFPDWHFPAEGFPPFDRIIGDLAELILSHPATTFIGAHVGCYAENLGWVSDLLDRAPNFNVDIAARIGELGRQPYTARKFILKHADRILFGTDFPANVETYRRFYRFLETDDEYFNYSSSVIPTQGRWFIYGLYLPEDVLAEVYMKNARRIFQSPDPTRSG
jgi:predicted TIM-barrel fold metal-dependent hydrolase